MASLHSLNLVLEERLGASLSAEQRRLLLDALSAIVTAVEESAPRTVSDDDEA